MLQLWAEAHHHLRVVGRAEAGGEDERRAARLIQRVLQLMQAVRGVDVDQNRANLGRGELGDRPFSAVGRPDADAVALLHAKRHQSTRAAVDLRL